MGILNNISFCLDWTAFDKEVTFALSTAISEIVSNEFVSISCLDFK